MVPPCYLVKWFMTLPRALLSRFVASSSLLSWQDVLVGRMLFQRRAFRYSPPVDSAAAVQTRPRHLQKMTPIHPASAGKLAVWLTSRQWVLHVLPTHLGSPRTRAWAKIDSRPSAVVLLARHHLACRLLRILSIMLLVVVHCRGPSYEWDTLVLCAKSR